MVCDAPNPKTRAAAVGVCVSLFTGSLAFLASARPKNDLGQMLSHIHQALLQVVRKDMSDQLHVLQLQGVLQCLEALIPNCPYHRLDSSVKISHVNLLLKSVMLGAQGFA